MKQNRVRFLSILLSLGMLLGGCGVEDNSSKKPVMQVKNETAVSQTETVESETQDEMISTESTEVESEEITNTETVEESSESVSSDETTGNSETTENVTESNNQSITSNDAIVENSESYQNGETTSSNANPYGTTSTASALARNVTNSIITGGMSDLEKAKAIHDWMVMNLDYDYQNYLNDTIPTTSWQVEGVLTTKYAICEGYARTFIALCDEAGLESLYVMGDTPQGLHAWNQVKIDGVWYNVDVCWDDPANRAFSDHSACRYNYFLVSDAQMSDHSAQSEKNTCNDSLRDQAMQMYCPWRNYDYISTDEQFATVIQNYVDNNASTMTIVADSNYLGASNIYNVLKDAINKCNVVNDYTITNVTYSTDQWGIRTYVCTLELNNGVFTHYTLATTEEELKQEILKLSTSSTETQYLFVTTSLLEQTGYLDSNSIGKWLYFDAGLAMSCGTFSPLYDGVYKAHVSELRPITSEDSFIESAWSYADIEAIVADRLGRGMNSFTIRYYYDTSTMTLDESYSHVCYTQNQIWAEMYGLTVNVSAQTTDSCFVFFNPVQ